ncbi:MAG: hypothetical protein KUG75_03635 [Pseudomonadales bacterium]|nr:hypothetical protein [Pseudomonadales bacterium]
MQINIKQQAEENLQFIRGAMQRAEGVSSVSGAGGIMMGVSALMAMLLASRQPSIREQLTIWIIAACIAVSAGAISSYLKARKLHTPLLQGDPARRFLLCLLPILLVGAIISWLLWPSAQIALLPALWMMLYGCGVLAAGTYATGPIMLTGGLFIVTGLFSCALPLTLHNFLLGISFGGFHICGGYWIYKHHGG